MNTSTRTPSQTGRSRSRLFVWVKRIFLGLIVSIFALVAVGAIYQAIGTSSDKHNFPPPGQLVDVGGYRLHIYCTGSQDSGNPTVILDTLAGGTSANWGWIQPEIAKVTRVCSYDRAGRGWSDPRVHPITLQQTVTDLHTLLQKAEIFGPYVLVGHSVGGIYNRKYAAEHPDEVVGLALVDSSHPDQFLRYPELQAENDAYLRMSAIFPMLARIGLFRFFFSRGGEIDFADLPPQQHAEVAAFWSSPEYFNSSRDETIALPVIFADAHSLGSLGDLPLAVISQGKNPTLGWNEMQDELASLSSNSIHITVPDATHASLALDQQHAHETSAAILQVVEAARTGLPLVSK